MDFLQLKKKSYTPYGVYNPSRKAKQSINHISEYLKYINIHSIYLFIPKAMG